MSDTVGLGYSDIEDDGTYARIIDNMDRPKRSEDKIDIITPDKTNKIPIMVFY